MLSSENKRRNAAQRDDSYDDIYIKEELPDGTQAEKRVDRVRFIFGLSCAAVDILLSAGLP